VIGRSLTLDGQPHTVIGVMPEGFEYPAAGTEFWTAMAFDAEEASRRNWRSLSMVGRLADDVTTDAALGELQTIAARLAAEYPAANEGVSAYMLPLREELVGAARATLLAVLGAIAFVLLIACTNVATLVLTRASTRRSEVAVRAALGAGRWRIVRQLVTESLLLAVAAGALGVLLGTWCVRFLAALVPAWLPLAVPVGLDGRAIAFTFTLALVTTVLFGLLPALHATRHDLADALRSGRATSSRGQERLRASLVIGEVALAVVLLVAAGLMLRSFRALRTENIGFDAGNVLRLQLGLTAARYQDAAIRTRLYEEVLEQGRAIAGVQRAAIVTAAPLAMSGGALIYTPEGQATHAQDATFRAVSDDYFAALGIDLRGRTFTAADSDAAPPVIIVGRELARRAWPDEEPLGKRLKLGNERSSDPWRTVVGVADDVRQWDVELEPRPAIYVPFRQAPATFAPRELLLRTAGDPLALANEAREIVHAIDDEVPVTVGTMNDLLRRALAARRFNMQIFAAFALTAVLLASIGLYGMVAYSVTHRTHEIGIRMALGARQAAVVMMVLRRGILLVGAGLLLGLLGALGATRALESLLYEVEGLDGVTLVLVPLLLALVGMLATLLPARRASRVEPVIALRQE
jgi:putative ABC transport system permease protein